jgi:hypothetical protein
MSKSTLNEAIGGRLLSAWSVAPGVVWVQTRSPAFARKLQQRGDSRLVTVGVAGGYLRGFEFLHGMAWARRLIGRYNASNDTATGEGIIRSILPVGPPFSPLAAEMRVTVPKQAKPTNGGINSPMRTFSRKPGQ